MKTNNVKTLSTFKDEFYGKIGTEKRDNLEKGFDDWKKKGFEVESKK